MMTLSDLLKDIRDSQKACEEDGRDSSIDGYAYLIRGRIYKKWADAIDSHLTSREAKGDAKPVAWLYSWDGAGYEAERCVVADASEKRARERAAQFDAEVVPLYTHPAAQEAAKSVVPHELPLSLISRAESIFQHCDVSDGMCECGDDMKNHPSPIDCGHSPVDHGQYVIEQWLKNAHEFKAMIAEVQERNS